MFYIKGAAFWHELDILVSNKGYTLDKYLSLLSNSQKESGKLSQEFNFEITKVIGEQAFSEVTSKYL